MNQGVCLSLLLAPLLAYADPGIPSEPLAYSGTVFEGSGPLQSNRDVTVRLYSAETQGTLLCTAPVVTAQASKQGRFEAPLGATCENIVRQNAEIWLEVFVSGAGAMTRTKLRSVPSALTAQRSFRTVATSGTAQISSNGLFVRASAGMYPGAWSFMGLSGYRAGKRVCETDVGTATAHVCAPEEAHRSALLGISVPSGWLMNMSGVQGYMLGSTMNPVNECSGHTENGPGSPGVAGATLGVAWDATSAGVVTYWCSLSYSILCCD